MASFGENLKRERESRNISLREIAETTKVNIRYLEALETDRFAALPGGVFTRGFIRAYAGYIGIDADAAVRGFHEALSASGVQGNEGALPDADRVSPRAGNTGGQTIGDPGVDEGGARPRISMGPDPRAAHGDGASARAAGGRRFLAIAFWVTVGGALLAGLFVMRPERSTTPPANVVGIGRPLPPEPSAEQEAFEPPEGMFVDAGPVVSGEAGAGTREPQAAPATETGTKPPPPRPNAEPAAAGIGGKPAPGPASPSVAPAPKRKPAARPAMPDRSTQPAPESSPPPAAGPAAPPPGPMALEVEVTRETWLWLACDSSPRIDRRVRPGESIAMQCLRSIRVSAHDAGAIRLRVNGSSCMPLGDDGSRVYGYTIRFDDAHLICRSSRTN